MFNPFNHPHDHRNSGPRPHSHQHFARFFGGDRGGRESFGRGFGMGGGRERMFDSGEFQLVILHLLSEKPSYGYELIKTMEEKLAGGYAQAPASSIRPSPCSKKKASRKPPPPRAHAKSTPSPLRATST